ncbi:MAG: PhnD/SsuA/transferrin family substrate-binding protein [Sideroxydans sp.]|nr:PhnD/SsuA/transferrin family substrate-binding protein [Sideroxydans sp.]
MSTSSFLSVCPHDTAKNLLGWFVLNSYLQRMLSENINFKPSDTFIEERNAVLDGNYQIVYANPYSALMFAERKGFLPVAKASDLYDETLLVVHKQRGIPEGGEVVIASATDKLIVHPLGRTLLPKIGLEESRVRYHYTGTHLKAAQAVLKGDAHAGFVFNETWRGLSATTKAELEVLSESRDGTAFHCFCVGPTWADRIDQVRSVLIGMNTDPKGRAILTELGFQNLEAINSASLDPARELLKDVLTE